MYTDAQAHAAQRRSPHFLPDNDVAERAVIDKSVLKGVGWHIA